MDPPAGPSLALQAGCVAGPATWSNITVRLRLDSAFHFGSADWNNVLADQTLQTLWTNHSNAETLKRQQSATLAAL
jgi:hypothetical protein